MHAPYGDGQPSDAVSTGVSGRSGTVVVSSRHGLGFSTTRIVSTLLPRQHPLEVRASSVRRLTRKLAESIVGIRKSIEQFCDFRIVILLGLRLLLLIRLGGLPQKSILFTEAALSKQHDRQHDAEHCEPGSKCRDRDGHGASG